jgi:hypothetical protein
MSEYAWLGVLASAGVTTLALASWCVMAVPYFDNAPYLHELRKNTRLAVLIGLGFFGVFFAIFYLGARFLNRDTSGPLIAFIVVILLLPFSMLLGTETWEHYNPKGINRVPGLTAVAVATGIGLAELGAVTVAFSFLL